MSKYIYQYTLPFYVIIVWKIMHTIEQEPYSQIFLKLLSFESTLSLTICSQDRRRMANWTE